MAREKSLTEESTAEQSSAGLDQLTSSELVRFTTLNDAYKEKFGFPFIMAIRGRNKSDIVASFERRLNNEREQEFSEAIEQIGNIALIRLRESLPQED